MKLSVLMKGLLASVSVMSALVSVAQADPRDHRSDAGVLDQNSKEEYVYVTGSHIRQKVVRRSIGTTTPYNVRIYTRRELQSTGRSTPGEALRALDPSISLGGRY